jgi:hypothetical protein
MFSSHELLAAPASGAGEKAASSLLNHRSVTFGSLEQSHIDRAPRQIIPS